MQGIREFFKKIQSLQAREIFLKTLIRDAVLKYTSYVVPIESIKVVSSVAHLGGISQAARSEIFIHTPAILKEIEAGNPPQKIVGIR